ncbi:MAG: hypothetical protein GTO24_10570, partial [candidate division Zixibacteria bacterium]|nr:hypothetical protein [candidate division Zixibacteria bacterium]
VEREKPIDYLAEMVLSNCAMRISQYNGGNELVKPFEVCKNQVRRNRWFQETGRERRYHAQVLQISREG